MPPLPSTLDTAKIIRDVSTVAGPKPVPDLKGDGNKGCCDMPTLTKPKISKRR